MKRLILFLTIALAVAAEARAGEITLGWNRRSDIGNISDMKILPGDSTFVMLTGDSKNGQIQVRSILTGDSISAFPFKIYSEASCAITPDSTRIIIGSGEGGNLALYSLPDFKVLKSYWNTNDTISKWYNPIAIDPIRPYVYAIVYALKYGEYGSYITRGQIIVFNYETMERVADLTEFSSTLYDRIAVSHDGKYLAAVNSGESHLKIWDLDSRTVIRDRTLCNFYSIERQGSAKCLIFSEFNNKNLIISGFFPQSSKKNDTDGIFVYNIEIDSIIDSTFAYGSNQVFSGYFVPFDGEKRILQNGAQYLSVINFETKTIESKPIFMYDDNRQIGNSIIHSKKCTAFLGTWGSGYTMVTYDQFKNTEIHNSVNTPIFPNPTSNTVQLKLECPSANQYYEVLSANGELLGGVHSIAPGASSIIIDFAAYPAGVYFVRVGCGNQITTYKVVKEG